VKGFLAAGHVCCVTGFEAYPPLSEKYKIPIVVTGFEPLDLLEGIRRTVIQLENGEARVENAYPRVVSREGNLAAQKIIHEVFEVTDRGWRGIGVIPGSGWKLREAYREFDAEIKFPVSDIQTTESSICRAGDVLQGAIKPNECEAFGKLCTPRNPLGATMVSSEGSCAAYYNYGRFVQLERQLR
jgi:hydrogenase expression/formation protein HypD